MIEWWWLLVSVPGGFVGLVGIWWGLAWLSVNGR